MNEHEAYVCARWGYAHRLLSHVVCPGEHRIECGDSGQNARIIARGTSVDAAWLAAATFTDERLEEIRQVEEELAWLKVVQSIFYSNPARRAIRARLLARTEAHLADLQRGMRVTTTLPTGAVAKEKP